MSDHDTENRGATAPQSPVAEVGRMLVRVLRWSWPGWWFYYWFVRRWIRHDCDRQPITCRLEVFTRCDWWLDV